jgi:hypothetical protein
MNLRVTAALGLIMNCGGVVEEECYNFTKGGSPQIRRDSDDANVIF